VGCTEKAVGFRIPIFQTVDIQRVTPPEQLPLVHMPIGSASTVAAGLAGLIAGGIGGAAYMAASRLPGGKDKNPPPAPSSDDTADSTLQDVGGK
jgi:hydrogenase small subunit